MNKTIFKNEVFSIVQKTEKDFELNRKGKLLSKADVAYSGRTFELKGKPEALLDFDGLMLPPGFEYAFIHEPKGFFHTYGLTTVSVVKKKVLINYFFSISDADLITEDLNVFKIFTGAFALAGRAGYDIHIDDYLTENKCSSIRVLVPAKGNLYAHYKKHLDFFETCFQKAAGYIAQNVLDRYTTGAVLELPKVKKKKNN